MRISFKAALSVFLLFFIVTVQAQDIRNEIHKFSRLLQLINTYYVEDADLEHLTETAIVKLLSELDPHSVYISKEDVDKMNEPLQGSFDGIGISFNIMRDTLMVVQTIPGGPSEKVGLTAGDRIIYIDDELVAGVGLTNQMVFDRLRGDKGTNVSVSIKRKSNNDLLVFNIIRDKIPIYSLDASYMVNDNTGYIKLNRFSATTSDEFLEAIRDLKTNNNVENLILDLRGNGGGFLKAAHEISDQFLSSNRMIVYTEGAKNPRKDYKAVMPGEFESGKLVILIDNGSASASEIVSGAVQDWDRGVIIGRRSFGKGLVQQPYPLTDGSMIRLTTAHYYTPSGKAIQKPYEGGVKEYLMDYSHRIESGELFNRDSIHVADSLAFQTLINKRTVYGGGGIIPDIFIAIDTSANYSYYNQLVRMSVVNQFVLDFVDKNRKILLEDYPLFSLFKENYNINNQMLADLWERGKEKDIEPDEESIKFIENHARRHLKALVARDLWGTNEYYAIVNSKDDAIEKAIEILANPKYYNDILQGNRNE